MALTGYSAATDVGLRRNNNEDHHLSLPFLGLWAVADGMGGHAAGEVASAIACQTLGNQIRAGTDLTDAIQACHKAVLQGVTEGAGGPGMGSTMVALRSRGRNFDISWVGDSRAYSWLPAKATPLEQITRDHSYVQMLYESGAIGYHEIANHPEKNIITQCLGSIDANEVQVDVVTSQWQVNQMILLCSDGLSDAVGEEEMADILTRCNNLDQATSNLVRAALNNGGRDNITVQIIAAPPSWLQILQNTYSKFTKLTNAARN